MRPWIIAEVQEWVAARWTQFRPTVATLAVLIARHAFSVAILAVTVVVAVLLIRLDKSLWCLSDCGPSPEGGWAYAKGLNLPGAVPDAKNNFPNMILYQQDSGDSGPLAKILSPHLWNLPLLPPAFFLAAVVTCFTLIKHPSKEKDPARWVGILFLLIVPVAMYVLIGFVGTRLSTGGGFVIASTAVASALAAAFHWWFFQRIGSHSSERTMRRHVNLPSARVLLIWSVLIGSLLNGAAALLIRDAKVLDRSLRQKPPRLFEPIVRKHADREGLAGSLRLKPAQRGYLETILDTLSRSDVIEDADLRTARQAMEGLTRPAAHNLVSQSLCRSGWYIALCCASLATAVCLPNKRAERLKLMFVFVSYVAIGIIFGLIYYDYFLLDAGRYHLLIETLFVDNAREISEAAKRCGGDCESLRLKLATFQGQAAHHEKILGLMASGYFASSVFAQDTPSLAIESDPPDVLTSDFTCNYQFRKEEPRIRYDQPLYYGHAKGVRVESECAQAVISGLALDSPSALGQLQTNRSSSIRLANFICNEAGVPTKKTERDYVVRIVGAADCTGSSERNDRYSDDRGRATIVEARRVVNAVWAWANRAEVPVTQVQLVNVNRLRHAFMAAAPHTFAQRRGFDLVPCEALEYDDILWPASDRGQRQTNDAQIHPARASLIEVLRRSADVTDRLHMQSGLTRNTTLTDMVYFSFVSFTTTGYGDIKAVSGPVRFCVITENILEILFAAIFFTAAMQMVRQE